MDQGFSEFLNNLRTSPAETSAAASHRQSLISKLTATFGMTAFFRTGSFGAGTNVRQHSDVDYFAVIPRGSLKQDSSRSLAEVASALRERFPQTGIRVDSPGVRISFGLDGAEATEIVPVDLTGSTLLGFRQFDMPDGSGGWKFSAPESHNAYVNGIDTKHGGKAKALVRFIKAWKYIRGVPVKSFYLEMKLARYMSDESQIIYDIDLRRVIFDMWQDGLAAIPDPRFPNDGFFISPCNTKAQRM